MDRSVVLQWGPTCCLVTGSKIPDRTPGCKQRHNSGRQSRKGSDKSHSSRTQASQEINSQDMRKLEHQSYQCNLGRTREKRQGLNTKVMRQRWRQADNHRGGNTQEAKTNTKQNTTYVSKLEPKIRNEIQSLKKIISQHVMTNCPDHPIPESVSLDHFWGAGWHYLEWEKKSTCFSG